MPLVGIEPEQRDGPRYLLAKKVVCKANKALAFLNRNLRVASHKLQELACFRLLRPCVECTADASDPYTKEHIKAIEQVQRRATGWVTSSYRQTTSVAALHAHLNVESQESRWRKARLSTMWKYVHGHSPSTALLPPNASPQTKTDVRQEMSIPFPSSTLS